MVLSHIQPKLLVCGSLGKGSDLPYLHFMSAVRMAVEWVTVMGEMDISKEDWPLTQQTLIKHPLCTEQ